MRSSILIPEVPGYGELQREIHDALSAQHPNWIEADGNSPTCDSYESLFAEPLVRHQTNSWPAQAPSMPKKEKLAFQKSRQTEIILT